MDISFANLLSEVFTRLGNIEFYYLELKQLAAICTRNKISKLLK